MDFIALAAALAVMGAIIAGFVALYQGTANPRSSLERRLGNLLGETNSMEATAADFEALRTKQSGKLPIIGSFLEGRSLTGQIAMDLERADMKLTPSEFIGLRI